LVPSGMLGEQLFICEHPVHLLLVRRT
jgi:hypothetical protein